jgi:hypothetical protein
MGGQKSVYGLQTVVRIQKKLGFWIGFGWETLNSKKIPNSKKKNRIQNPNPKIHEIQNPNPNQKFRKIGFLVHKNKNSPYMSISQLKNLIIYLQNNHHRSNFGLNLTFLCQFGVEFGVFLCQNCPYFQVPI